LGIKRIEVIGLAAVGSREVEGDGVRRE